ncbi:hypothetical protein HDE_13030 [Halotydeus destructor]|nr:hypothetical protein HDE_13030 [Halotydeus destructor]
MLETQLGLYGGKVSPTSSEYDRCQSPSPSRAGLESPPVTGQASSPVKSSFSVEALLRPSSAQLADQRHRRSPPAGAHSASDQGPQLSAQAAHFLASGSRLGHPAAHQSANPFTQYMLGLDHMGMVTGHATAAAELAAAARLAQHHQSHQNALCSLREWSESQARFHRTFGALNSSLSLAARVQSDLKFSVSSILSVKGSSPHQSHQAESLRSPSPTSMGPTSGPGALMGSGLSSAGQPKFSRGK